MMYEASRRVFLRRLGVGLALAPILSLSEIKDLRASDKETESYWQMIRWQFPFREEKVPMNAANLCPSPLSVSERVTEWTRDIDVDCSSNNRAKFTALLEQSQAAVAAHLGVSADEIALVRNTSEANNTINNGIPLEQGDEVVVWEQNHPTNNVAWDVRAARFGLKVKRVKTPKRPAGIDELVNVFAGAMSERTRVLAITHVSNVSGQRLPVAELCEVAHRRGIHVHVDGAQSWGALNVNLRELGCDSYSSSAHKWFVGPKEVGVLYVKGDRVSQIWPNVVAPGWGNDVEPDVKGARKFESLGQRDDACLSAVATTVQFHQAIGPARIESRLYQLADALKQGLKEVGAELVTPESPALSAGVCIVRVNGKNRQKVLNHLYEQHGIAASTAGGLRLCPHFYNTMEHVERAVKAVRSLPGLLA